MADTIIIPTCGKIKELELILGKDLAENLTLKLFTNDADVASAPADLVAGSFTEMTTHGYVAKTLTMATWDTPTLASTKAVSQYDAGSAVQWTFTAAVSVNVYGYYVVMATTGTLLWACKFETAKPIANAGETISVIPEKRYTQSA